MAKFLKLHLTADNKVIIINANIINTISSEQTKMYEGRSVKVVQTTRIVTNSEVLTPMNNSGHILYVHESPGKIYDMLTGGSGSENEPKEK